MDLPQETPGDFYGGIFMWLFIGLFFFSFFFLFLFPRPHVPLGCVDVPRLLLKRVAVFLAIFVALYF